MNMDVVKDPQHNQMNPVRYACFVLSLIGLGISIYLTIAHFTSSSILACPNTGTINCAKVTTSAQSYFLKIPVAIWGLAFYLYLTLLNSPFGFKRKTLRTLRLISMIIGVIFVLYLISAELLVIGSICLWCTSVHVVTILLFGAVIYDYFMITPEQQEPL